MELAGIGQIAHVERHLDILDVVNVFLGILLELLDVNLLRRYDATDLFYEVLPARVLVAHDAFHQVGKSGFVLIVLQHAQARKRRELEAVRLLVGIVHEVTNVEDETKDADQAG